MSQIIVAISCEASLPVLKSGTEDSQDQQAFLPLHEKHENTMDSLDCHNHPRLRQSIIFNEIHNRNPATVTFLSPPNALDGLTLYELVHDKLMIEFLSTTWDKWAALGVDGRDEAYFHPSTIPSKSKEESNTPPMVPDSVPLHRDRHQRPSSNIMGQIGFYCTDNITPIMSSLVEELQWDAAIVSLAVDEAAKLHSKALAYAVTTHPGHHASHDSFGGYCYVNHAALAARLLQTRHQKTKVCILDVDYHCGNGTASLFYHDPTVLVVSIHCDPDWDYPFHSGFADQTGVDEGEGYTIHVPLPPGTQWKEGYEEALNQAMDKIMDYGAEAIVLSLGLDTHEGDAVAVRRAGFKLSGKDYLDMGTAIGRKAGCIPAVIIQEGGYKMDTVGSAASDVVTGFAKSRLDAAGTI